MKVARTPLWPWMVRRYVFSLCLPLLANSLCPGYAYICSRGKCALTFGLQRAPGRSKARSRCCRSTSQGSGNCVDILWSTSSIHIQHINSITIWVQTTSYVAAMASISTSTSFGNRKAEIQVRAGFGLGSTNSKSAQYMRPSLHVGSHFSYTSFIAPKSSILFRYTLTLTTFSQDEPAAFSTLPRLAMH